MDRDQTPRWGERPEDRGDDSLYQKPKSSFLQRWMAREASRETPEDIEEDSEVSSDTKKKKRFGKLFSRLFPSIVTKTEKKESAQEAPKRSFFAELIPDSMRETPEPQQQEATANEPLKPASVETVATPEAYSTEPIEGHEEISYSAPEAESLTNSHDIESEEVPRYKDPLPVPEVPPPFFATIPPEVRQNRLVAEHEPQEVVISKQTLLEQAALTPRVPEIPPTERRHGAGAVVAFLAAEYLSRRRDKKLKKEIEKLEKQNQKQREQTEALDAKIKDAKPSKTVVYKRTSQPQPVPELPSRKTVVNNEYSAPEIRLSVVAQKKDSSKNKDSVVAKDLEPEQEEKRADEKPNIALFLKKREKELEEMRRKPPQALESEDAEVDRRSEKEFDRRHEIMDEPPHRVQVGLSQQSLLTDSAASIGEVLQGKQRQEQLNTVQANRGASGLRAHDTSAKVPSSLYQQSIQYGVGAALVIIIFGLLAYQIF